MLWLRDYFKTHPCVDCGEPNPLKLSFDHVRGKKAFAVSSMLGCCNHERLYEGVWTAEISGWSEHFLRFIREMEASERAPTAEEECGRPATIADPDFDPTF
jgi:hypothetical protein